MRYALHQAIVQVTPFCNINCRYCYLPDRAARHKISAATVSTIAKQISDYHTVAQPLIWTWHAGEPLSVGLTHFRECHNTAVAIFDKTALKPSWSVQTNGTLIDEHWADFLIREDYTVSVSLDGPESLHDSNRKLRSGAGSHSRAVRGFTLLRERGRTPPILMVVTHEGLDRGAEIVSYFGELGAKSIALNFEEIEGVNRCSSFTNAGCSANELRSKVIRFIRESAFVRDRDFPDLEIREYDNFLRLIMADQAAESFVSIPMRYLTFGWDGAVFTFSPELAGQRRPDGSSFSIGNVNEETLDSMLERVLGSTDHESIKLGKMMCKEACEYFVICGGGNPGNKYFENGTFASTETEQCRLRYQYMVDGILEDIGDSRRQTRHV